MKYISYSYPFTAAVSLILLGLASISPNNLLPLNENHIVLSYLICIVLMVVQMSALVSKKISRDVTSGINIKFLMTAITLISLNIVFTAFLLIKVW
jgi:hypothetical protein